MKIPLRAPTFLNEILHALDPVEGGTSVVIAPDLLPRDFPRAGLTEAGEFLDRLLADPDVSNADLKGLLNRETSSSWSMEFSFGADAKAARRFLEALRQAIGRERA